MKHLLSGVRILDLSQMLAGPYTTLMLGDIGAEIIKIEEPGEGDRTRSMGPHFLKGTSAYFISINRNKKSVTLNLKDTKDREKFYKLVKKADVVFDNFRPGVLERLRCDFDTLRKFNPKIISCSISAFGESGPYRDLPAFDLSIQAIGGAMSYTGEEGREPIRMGIPMGDLAGGMFAAFAISSALYLREKTGLGCRIDISLLDSLVSLHTYVAQYYFVSGKVPKPIGSAHQSVVPYQAFKTKDMYIVIAVYTDKFWEKLCSALSAEELVNDSRFSDNEKRREHREELIPLLRKIFEKRTAKEWLELLSKEGVPSAPVNTLDLIFSDPQILARNMVIEIDHPTCGKLRMLGNPVKVRGMKEEFRPWPELGQNNEEIFREIEE